MMKAHPEGVISLANASEVLPVGSRKGSAQDIWAEIVVHADRAVRRRPPRRNLHFPGAASALKTMAMTKKITAIMMASKRLGLCFAILNGSSAADTN